MTDVLDKKIFFPKTFNEQMAWIDEEIEHIFMMNRERGLKNSIKI